MSRFFARPNSTRSPHTHALVIDRDDRSAALLAVTVVSQRAREHHAGYFSATYLGLREWKAGTQIFILDACREATQALLRTTNVAARVFRTSESPNPPERNAPILMGATAGGQAHGPVGGVSFFTQPLLRCLDGIGAAYRDGDYWPSRACWFRISSSRLLTRPAPCL